MYEFQYIERRIGNLFWPKETVPLSDFFREVLEIMRSENGDTFKGICELDNWGLSFDEKATVQSLLALVLANVGKFRQPRKE